MTRKNRLRFLRNLAALLLVLTVVWWLYGCPLPDRMDFRRWERQVLLPPSEIVLELDQTQTIWGPAYVGLSGDRAAGYCGGFGEAYALPDGPGLIPLPFLVLRDAFGWPDYAVGLVAVCPPEPAESAHLTVTNHLGTFTAGGWRQDAAFIFAISPEPDEDGATHISSTDWEPDKLTYRLEFFDAAGASLGVAEKEAVNQQKING